MGSVDDEDLIYLDYNATTPLDPSVLDSITKALRDAWANPSSKYPQGLQAKAEVDTARERVAAMISAAPREIVFTSGGTEANHLVFHSVLTEWRKRRSSASRFHVISCPIEHDAVILPLQKLEEDGDIELTLLDIDPTSGAVRPDDLRAALRPNTRLVSLMLANNETGAIQPVAAMAEIVAQRNARLGATEERVLFHTDAAQAIGKIAVDVEELGVDYLTVVGHKFYGPRIGALFVRHGEDASTSAPILPMFFGGGQERGLRPGTENTGMIAGLGQAALLVSRGLHADAARMQTVRDLLEARIAAALGEDSVRFNHRFPAGRSLPNTCSVSFLRVGQHGRALLALCPRLCASVGAACHSERDRPSHILLRSGVEEDAARCTLRLTVGRASTADHATAAAADIVAAVQRLSAAA